MERIEAYLATNAMSQKHEDPFFHARWCKGRFGSTRAYGKRAAEIAATRATASEKSFLPTFSGASMMLSSTFR